MNIKYMNTRDLMKTVIVAALYAALTVGLAPISYAAIQFRLSELLVVLAFIDRKYIPGLVLGCALANIFSPLGLIDVVVGTIATFISVYMMSRTKNLLIATLWPTINCVFVGAELYYVTNAPFWITTFYVALGEFTVVTVIGYPLFKMLMKNERLMKELKN